MSQDQPIAAPDIVRLLRQRHSADLFVPECKDGPSQMGFGHRRLDAWVMARSWTNPLVTGYEIKVSRSDFLQDSKWQDYLPMCNQLYFVCPYGMIQPPEMPAEVGLLWTTKKATKLYMKAKAAHRQVEIPEEIFRYILMSRATITDFETDGDPRSASRRFWERWLIKKELDSQFSWHLRGELKRRFDEEIAAVRTENERLKRRQVRYDAIGAQIERALGIDLSEGVPTDWQVESRIEKLQKIIPRGLVLEIERLTNSLDSVRDQLHELRTGETEQSAA